MSREEQLAEIRDLLRVWDGLSRPTSDGFFGVVRPIQDVRGLEEGTMMVLDRRPEMVNEGYHRLPALDGYSAWLRAFRVIDTGLNAQQIQRIDRASGVLRELRESYNWLGERPSDSRSAEYTARKLAQLQSTGETFMLTGHRSHFNITRIQRLPDGSYSYTLYDAGHETRVTGQEYDRAEGRYRAVANAIEERRIRPGTNIGDIIRADIVKINANSDSPEYTRAKTFIDRATNGGIIRAEPQFAQRRGNCTTRGQRLLVEDLIGDGFVAARLREFIVNDDVSVHDIRDQLVTRENEIVRGVVRIVPSPQPSPSREGWQDYESSAYGDSKRYATPFRADSDTREPTPEMLRFEERMRGQGVHVRWGWKGDNAYAYVPKRDTASIENLARTEEVTRLDLRPAQLELEENIRSIRWGDYNSPRYGGDVMRGDVSALNTTQRDALVARMNERGISAELITGSDQRSYVQVRTHADPTSAQAIDHVMRGGSIDSAPSLRIESRIRSLSWGDYNSPRFGGDVMRADVSGMNEIERANFTARMSQRGIPCELIVGSDQRNYVQIRTNAEPSAARMVNHVLDGGNLDGVRNIRGGAQAPVSDGLGSGSNSGARIADVRGPLADGISGDRQTGTGGPNGRVQMSAAQDGILPPGRRGPVLGQAEVIDGNVRRLVDVVPQPFQLERPPAGSLPAPANDTGGARLRVVPTVETAVVATTAVTLASLPSARSTFLEGAGGRGVGLGLGGYMLYEQLRPGGSLQRDLYVGGSQGTLSTASTGTIVAAVATDTLAIGSHTTTLLANGSRAATVLEGGSAVAGKVFLPLAVLGVTLQTSALLEGEDGRGAVAAAVGGGAGLLAGVWAGTVAGAAIGGAAGTIVPGAGNVVGAVGGAIVGAVVGLGTGLAAGWVAKHAVGDSAQAGLDRSAAREREAWRQQLAAMVRLREQGGTLNAEQQQQLDTVAADIQRGLRRDYTRSLPASDTDAIHRRDTAITAENNMLDVASALRGRQYQKPQRPAQLPVEDDRKDNQLWNTVKTAAYNAPVFIVPGVSLHNVVDAGRAVYNAGSSAVTAISNWWNGKSSQPQSTPDQAHADVQRLLPALHNGRWDQLTWHDRNGKEWKLFENNADQILRTLRNNHIEVDTNHDGHIDGREMTHAMAVLRDRVQAHLPVQQAAAPAPTPPGRGTGGGRQH